MEFNYSLDATHDLRIAFDPKADEANVFLNELLIFRFDSYSHMFRGEDINADGFGHIYLKYVSEAEGFEIKLGDLHHPLSAKHPKKFLRKLVLPLVAGILPTVFKFILTLIYLQSVIGLGHVMEALGWYAYAYLIYTFFIVVGVCSAALLARNGHWGGIVLGVTLLTLDLILILLTYLFIRFPGFLDLLLFVVELSCCLVIYKNIHLVSQLRKHKVPQKQNDLILDNLK